MQVTDYDERIEENYTCNKISHEHQMLFLSISPWIQGAAQISVSLIGLLTNFVSILVLCSKQMKCHMFNRLLVFLVVFDNIHLVLAILDSIRHEFGPKLKTYHLHQTLFVYFLYPTQNINLTCIIYMKIVLGLEREVNNDITYPKLHSKYITTTQYNRCIKSFSI